MDKPIGVGDLVQVVFPPRNHECNCLGAVFKVTRIRKNTDRIKLGKVYKTLCRWCGYTGSASTTKTILVAEGGKSVVALSRLKRIPPLSELEGVRTEETLKECV